MVPSFSFPEKPKKSSYHFALLASWEPIYASEMGVIARILGTIGPSPLMILMVCITLMRPNKGAKARDLFTP